MSSFTLQTIFLLALSLLTVSVSTKEHKYKIGLVADLGIDSKNATKGTYFSYYKEGYVYLNSDLSQGRVDFDDKIYTLESGINDAGEGFELSALNYFNGKLYACDDETGILYEIVRNDKTNGFDANPSILLPNGNKGLKCEWTTIKDGHLYVGSSGILVNKIEDDKFKEDLIGPDGKQKDRDRFDDFQFNIAEIRNNSNNLSPAQDGNQTPTTTGIHIQNVKDNHTGTGAVNNDIDNKIEWDRSRQFVIEVSPTGQITRHDWTKQYQQIALLLGVDEKTGFVIHEGVAWSQLHNSWLFMPRKISNSPWNPNTFELTGSNGIGLLYNSFDDGYSFGQVKFKSSHPKKNTGFTDIKFLPESQGGDVLVLGLKAELNLTNGAWFSTLSIYNLTDGVEIMSDQVIGDGVYTGVEILEFE